MDSSWIGGHNMQIGEVTGDLSILLEQPALEMLASVHSAAQDQTVRVLLPARSHTHFWDQLEAELGGLGIAFAPPAALTGFPERSRETLFHEAATSFAQALELPDLSPPAPDDLTDPSYASPLTLHMAALAAVVAAGNDDGHPGDFSRYLLLHEQRRWNASTDANTMRALTTDSDYSEGSDDFDMAIGRLGLAWEQLAFCLPEGDPERAAVRSEFHRIFGADPQEAEDHAEERCAPDT
ncbi:hypothetical protein [Streptomyces griseus]|uniref:hypothetical protein n=1 Tax=Streptomyces griseus TaxID=1911 RepID=UPI0033F4DE00